MSAFHPVSSQSLSITEAATAGLPALVRTAEAGTDIVLNRHGQPVALVVSTQRAAEIDELKQDLIDVALLLARAATDNGSRTDLDVAIEAFGFSREELESLSHS